MIHPLASGGRLKGILAAAVCLILLWTAGCRTDPAVTDPAPVLHGAKTLLVVPFKDLSKVYGENRNVRCPLSGNVFMAGPVPDRAPETLTRHLRSLLASETDFRLLTAPPEAGLEEAAMKQRGGTLAEGRLLTRAGRMAGADLVMAGHIYRYRERVGNGFSVESPASAAFDLHLIRVRDGRLLWTGYLDETQHSLSENLFLFEIFLEREAKWLTVEELALSGLKHVVEPFTE